jgi:ligand-binding SRPBCC domain-containing protein
MTPLPTPPTHVFTHRSVIPTTVDALWAFHDEPRVLYTLTPPPIFIRVLRDDRDSLTSGEIEFQLWFGPFPAYWLARHEPGPTSTSFVDRMLVGPAAVWVHEHIMQPTDGGAELIDRITIAHRASGFWAVFTRLFFGRLPLRVLFTYRHWRTRRAVTGKRFKFS